MKSLSSFFENNRRHNDVENVFKVDNLKDNGDITDGTLENGNTRSSSPSGYNPNIDSIRKLYKNMPKAYLDNAAAPLLLSTIPHKAADSLCSQTLVNPHSQGFLGMNTQNLIEDVRLQVSRMLHIDPSSYDVVFCANATAGVKSIGEGQIETAHLAYKTDSHTSIVGLRTLAKSFSSFGNIEDIDFTAEHDYIVAWPLQSNFDGRRYPGKKWVKEVHNNGGLCLVDIASFAATEMPDLSEINPDFAVLSFYKIFGMPDLGGLIVKKSRRTREFWKNKRYFGGGTVSVVAPSTDYMVRPSKSTDVSEDGTLPIHSILMLKMAISEFESVFHDFSVISRHTKAVANYCRNQLQEIKGITTFGEYDTPIVTFMAASDDTLKIGHNELVTAASLADIHLRGGTLCNIGGFTDVMSVSDSTIIRNHETLGKTCNDQISFISQKPTGVIRASFGPYSNYQDVDALVELLQDLARRSTQSFDGQTQGYYSKAVVKSLNIYPIKSCAGVSLHQSLLCESGLEHDRQFCIVELSTKAVMSSKKNRSMIFIKPSISESTLNVRYEGNQDQNYSDVSKNSIPSRVSVPLDTAKWHSTQTHDDLTICLDRAVVEFLSNALKIPCTSAKHTGGDMADERAVSRTTSENRNRSTFANASPLLIVATASANNSRINDINVFRPNIVLETDIPWAEDNWKGLKHKNDSEIVFLGKCRRCNMICVTNSGKSDSFPYMQLCRHRKIDGKSYFGQHASSKGISLQSTECIWSIGDVVYSF